MTEWIGKPVNFFGSSKAYKKQKLPAIRQNFFFGSANHKYPTPSKMFSDSDRDGVANVFDCKPNNPRQQGLIDAIVGAVKGVGKGGVKTGWREGMAKKGNPLSRAYEGMRERQRAKKIKKEVLKGGDYLPKKGPETNPHRMQTATPELEATKYYAIPQVQHPKETKPVRLRRETDVVDTSQIRSYNPQDPQITGYYVPKYVDVIKSLNQTRPEKQILKDTKPMVLKDIQQGRWAALKRIAEKIKQVPDMPGQYTRKALGAIDLKGAIGQNNVGRLSGLMLYARRANPKYDMSMEYRADKMRLLQKDISNLKNDLSTAESESEKKKLKRMIKKRESQLESKALIQRKQALYHSRIAGDQTVRSFKKGIVESFPMITSAARGSTGKSLLGAPGQRGRPRGTLDPRYAKYGGVYGYRKAKAAEKRAYKMMLQQQIAQAKQARAVQRTPYEYVQPEQMTPEIQQAMQQPTIEQMQMMPTQSEAAANGGQYNQQQITQIPQQFQEIPMQMPVEPQKRPIATVFKGSGGSPYPPVSSQSLQNTRQTIPYGYVESVDAFTGRRFMKRLPPTERWSGQR